MMTDTAGSTDSAGLFSAPRRFDMTTILVVTTAYAAVFALLRAVRFPAMAVLLVAAFFTLVALGQAILFGGKHPRSASALIGSVFFLIILIAYSLIFQQAQLPDTLLLSILFCLISGAICGYVGGVLVGFVFMVAHWIHLVLSSDGSRPDLLDE
jgi:hypothetical protein